MPKTQTVFITITAAAALGVIATIGSVAQQALSGAQKLMVVQATRLPGKVHILPATLETTQWGWFDNAELPRLTIDSGDTVVFETMSHSHGQLWPGRTIDELKKLRTDWPGRGPMTITGPVRSIKLLRGRGVHISTSIGSARWPSSALGSRSRCDPSPVLLASRAGSPGATTPSRPAPLPEIWTIASSSKAPPCMCPCSCAARWCGPGTHMLLRATAR